MKKTYVKPMIQFEDFKISASIADVCGEKVSASINSCYRDYGDATIFTNSNGDCVYKDNEEICYHVPNYDSTLFGS